MDANAIIERLAAESNLYGLPGSWCWDNTDVPAAAARLHCYAGRTKWALVGEELYFDEDQWGSREGFMRVIHCFGSASCANRYIFPTLIGDGDHPLFIEGEDGSVDAAVNPRATTVRIRDTVVAIQQDRDFLAEHVIVPPGVQRFEGSHLYRALCSIPASRQLLLSTPAEIRRALRLHSSLEMILVLDDWASPDLAEDFPTSECGRMLAEVMAHRAPERYEPTEPANMHWRYVANA